MLSELLYSHARETISARSEEKREGVGDGEAVGSHELQGLSWVRSIFPVKNPFFTIHSIRNKNKNKYARAETLSFSPFFYQTLIVMVSYLNFM